MKKYFLVGAGISSSLALYFILTAYLVIWTYQLWDVMGILVFTSAVGGLIGLILYPLNYFMENDEWPWDTWMKEWAEENEEDAPRW